MHADSPRTGRMLGVCLSLAVTMFCLQVFGNWVVPGRWTVVVHLFAPLILKAASLVICVFIFVRAKISLMARCFFVALVGSIFLLHFPFGLGSSFISRWIASGVLATCGNTSAPGFPAFANCMFWAGLTWTELFFRFAVVPILVCHFTIILIQRSASGRSS